MCESVWVFAVKDDSLTVIVNSLGTPEIPNMYR